MQISNNKLVTIEYKLYVKNNDGSLEIMEETSSEAPLKYIHGAGMMLPKFEEALDGRNVGDSFEFSIDSHDAYGERSDDNIIDLPMDVFTTDGNLDTERFFKGAIVPLVDANGDRINAEIVSIGETEVKVDFNHPLAGEDLVFKVRVLDVHTPTEEELHSMSSCSGCGGGCHHEESDCGGCSGCGGH